MKTMRELAFLALMSTAVSASATAISEGTKKPDWTRNAVIYEVNWRQSTDDGMITSLANNLEYYKELGVDILWLMPINPISVVNRKGELGSYYASQSYYELNQELGVIDEFKKFVKKAHELGMKVIIDWVANHTGCDNIWLTSHPDWYVYENGKLVSQWDWTDTYKLDYNNKEMRQGMINAMKFWVNECDIDGFRCDVAFLVPTDFWEDAREQISQIKPVFMLAEASDAALCNKAFDMVYNWPLLFLYDEIAKGKKDCSKIDSVVCAERDSFAIDSYQMNHITNHDRNSWDGTEFERLGDGVKAFAVLDYVVPGMPLLYTGQEVGYNHRFEFFKRDTPAPLEKNEWYNFYKSLNNLKHTNAALKAGTEGAPWKAYKTTAPTQALVCSRLFSDAGVVYVGNLSAQEVAFKLSEAPAGQYKNFFTGETVTIKKGMSIKMKPWEYMLLVK